MINGALTIGTLDGANIEMREEVGADDFFLFGMDAAGVEAARATHDPKAAITADPDLAAVMALLEGGHFNHCEGGIFDDIIDSLTSWGDYWMVMADFDSYIAARPRSIWPSPTRWAGPARPSATAPPAASSRRTARCANTTGISTWIRSTRGSSRSTDGGSRSAGAIPPSPEPLIGPWRGDDPPRGAPMTGHRPRVHRDRPVLA